MPRDLQAFLSACNRGGILLDTNALLLFIVGRGGESDIKLCKRTAYYSETDYTTLIKLVECSRGKINITPYVISELSNLVIDAKTKIGKYSTAATMIVKLAKESYSHKDTLIANKHISYLGFTDISILSAAENTDCGIVTSDSALYRKLLDEGRNAIHLQTFTALGNSPLR